MNIALVVIGAISSAYYIINQRKGDKFGAIYHLVIYILDFLIVAMKFVFEQYH